jgi:diguanylate cyclase (GGDEF)-like protein
MNQPDQNKNYLSPAEESQSEQAVLPREIFDSLPEPEFDLLTRVAADVFDMPVAVIGLMDSERLWFKSQLGMEMPKLSHQIAFGAHAIILPDEVLVVEDLRLDHRFQETPLVTHAPHLCFYAGAPLVGRDGNSLGTIAVVDTQPRKFSEAQRTLLRDLSKLVINDLENRNRANRLGKLAMTDQLTGLPNRILFHERLDHEIKKSHRTGLPLSLLIINLDRFKEVNDALGYRKGDLLLIEAARRISGCVGETGTVARLSGDEFAVILPALGGNPHIERIAECIVQKLNRPFMLENDMAYISASIGITHYPDEARDVDNLLTQADQAMHKAKGTGRDQFCFFTPSMQQESQQKLALTNDLRHALARNELHVYYQPIVDLVTGKITKGEALLRWKHPQRGMISPTVFIPLAEESGLIHSIGDWVFQEAVANVARWHKQFGRTVQVGINKSPIQLSRKAKQGEDWGDMLAKLKLPVNSIKVEITEGVLLKDSPTIKMKLINFQNSGVEVSIDDFGTGFSSLSYLKKFNVDYLKIDQSFISHLTEDATDRTVTEAIIMMAHKLGIKTIAEGVETAAQRDMLVAFGCDYAQGFLYSPAIPSIEFEQMIASQA